MSETEYPAGVNDDAMAMALVRGINRDVAALQKRLATLTPQRRKAVTRTLVVALPPEND